MILQEVGAQQPKPATSDTSQSSAAALRLVVPALLKASQTSAPVTTATVTNRGLQIQSVPFSTESSPKMVTTASSPTLVKPVFSSGPSPKLSKTAPQPESTSVKPPNPVSILKKPVQSVTSPVSVLKKTGQAADSVQQKTLASTITASLQPKLITTSKKVKLLGTPPHTGLSSAAPQASRMPSTTGSLASAGSLTSPGSHLVSSTISSSASHPTGSAKSLSLSLPSKGVRKVNSQPVIRNEPAAKRPIMQSPTTTSPVASKPGGTCPSPREASSQHSVNTALAGTQTYLLSRIQSLLAHQSATNTVTASPTSTKVSSPASALIGQSTSMSSQAQVGKVPALIPGIVSSQAQLMQSHSSVLGTNASTPATAQIGLAHVVISRAVPSQSQLGHTHSSVRSSANGTAIPGQVRLAQVSTPTSSSQVSLPQTYASVPGTVALQGTLGQTYLAAIPRSSPSSQLIQPRSILKQPQTTFHSTQVLTEHSYILKATTAPSEIRSRDNSNILDPTRKS